MEHDVHQQRVRFSRRLLAFCLLLILAASVTGSLVQRSWGRVAVMEIVLPTQNGQWVAADLFRPKTATKDTPAPLVVVVPGFQRSKETLSNISIELSRRGMVVIAIDPYAQGNSSASLSSRAATTEGYGMFAVVDYAARTGNLNYVDVSRIGTTGHSAGGNAAIQGARYFGREAQKSGEPSKLHSIFVSGYVLTLTDAILRDVRSNVGMSYALFDEGAYRNELANGDMRRAPEALRLLNTGTGPGNGAISEVEIGRYYGTVAERNLRVVHNERTLHPFQPYSIEATANQIEYFEKVFGLESALASSDQVWYWKELMTFLALLAAFISVVPLGQLLLAGVPYFQVLVHPVPAPQPRPEGAGRLVFWSLFVLSALIACFSYIPMTELSNELFVDASSREQTWFFPQRMNNGVMLWALLNGVVGAIIFWLSYRLYGREKGITPAMWGTQTNPTELKRTGVLAVTLFLFFFALLSAVYYFLHVDYRFVFIGVRAFNPVLFVILLMYAPMFFVFFLTNSLRVNGALRLEGQSEVKSMLLAGVANSLGLFFIVLMQYVTFARTGTVFWTDGWLYINLLFAVVPIMFFLPFFNRLFFRMTGRIYLGPMAMCLIFIMILVSNTVCYVPL